jgi:desulfoferrodoxin (superoxide reductase-like protein)
LSVCPQFAHATAPKDVKITYDATSQILTVTITHKSAFTNSHYIKYVEITKNGDSVSKNVYESQPDPETFTYTYPVPAAKGDSVTVKASCSMYGSKTATLDIQ